MKHLIELYPRGLLNAVFGVGKKQVNSGGAPNSLRFWWFVLRRHVSMQVSLQLVITLSFAALSIFRRSGLEIIRPVTLIFESQFSFTLIPFTKTFLVLLKEMH